MAKKIRVQINSSQVVRYSQIVEMTPEEWAELKAESGVEMPFSWLNLRDVLDADDPEGVSAVVVDAKGLPRKPRDSHEWGI